MDTNKGIAIFGIAVVSAFKKDGIPEPVPKPEINAYRCINIRK
jgi:hypothetical protein